MFRNGLEPWHILVMVAVLVLLFGSKKLPEMARGLGKSMRILKAETKGLHGDDDDAQPAQASPAAQPAQNAQTEQKELNDRAARLRAEAARLEQEAKRDDGAPLNGVPVSDAERARRNN
jgi:sec-independent protein translocase protein TatA